MNGGGGLSVRYTYVLEAVFCYVDMSCDFVKSHLSSLEVIMLINLTFYRGY